MCLHSIAASRLDQGRLPYFQLTTLKLTWLVSAPPGVVTTTLPVVAPLGTTAVMKVLLTTLKVVAGTLLKVTLVVPVKPWPRICALCPALPLGSTKAMNGPRLISTE